MSPEEERAILELAHGIEMAFRHIPPGRFRMGSRGNSADEEPVHLVAIPQPFWMAETPVTQAQFAVWTREERIDDHKNHFDRRPNHPAESMDWYQAVWFCAWITRQMAEQLPDDGKLAWLPTEAEWEYACRAGTDTDFYTGDGEAPLRDAGWFAEPRDSGSTHPVRLKAPNAFGLYDMSGNVWEWCYDGYEGTPYRRRVDGDIDPGWKQRDDSYRKHEHETGFVDNDQCRVLRGGSWYTGALGCRSTCRHGFGPLARFHDIGFRVCLVRGPDVSGGAEEERDRRGQSRILETEAERRGWSRMEHAQPEPGIANGTVAKSWENSSEVFVPARAELPIRVRRPI